MSAEDSIEKMKMRVEWSVEDLKKQFPMLPLSGIETLVRYRDNGCPAGSFTEALLTNDLMGAFGKADCHNKRVICDYCVLIYNYMPAGCHGNVEIYEQWIKNGGAKGLYGE